jgi:hypothetical protein
VDLVEWHMWWKQAGAPGVRRILIDAWDPIGVAGSPDAVDEYDAYVAPIGGHLREGATVSEVEGYLRHVRETAMGLDSPHWRSRDHEAAERLVEWYAAETRRFDP